MQGLAAMEREIRKRNLIIFGLNEVQNENNWNTCYRVLDMFATELHVNLQDQHIDNVFWVGRRNRKRPLVVKFTSVLTRDFILERAYMLKGSGIRISMDYCYETRVKRKELLNYMWAARRKGHHAVLSFDKLRLDGKIFDLEYCRRNFEVDTDIRRPRARSESPPSHRIEQHHRRSSSSHASSSNTRKEVRETAEAANFQDNVRTSQPRPNFILGTSQGTVAGASQGSVVDVSQPQNEGNSNNEHLLQTMYSPHGSIVRVNKNRLVTNTGNNYYNLRNWVTNRP